MGAFAVTFQILAGVLAALLTVARPFMRNEDRRHRIGHSVVGIAAIGCLITAGVLGYLSQSSIATNLAALELSIQELGKKIGQTGSPQDVLNSADTRISRLEKLAGPRQLSPTEQSDVANKLAALGPLEFQIDALSQDRETMSFCEQLSQTFRLARWNGRCITAYSIGYSGVVISKHVESEHPEVYSMLRTMLPEYGITVNDDVSQNSFTHHGVVEIILGPK